MSFAEIWELASRPVCTFIPLPLSTAVLLLLSFAAALWQRFFPKTVLFVLSALFLGGAVALSFVLGSLELVAALCISEAVVLLLTAGKGGRK